MTKSSIPIKGFIRLTSIEADNKPMLISLQSIITVRPAHSCTLINITNSPFTRAAQEIKVSEVFEEVILLISEASF